MTRASRKSGNRRKATGNNGAEAVAAVAAAGFGVAVALVFGALGLLDAADRQVARWLEPAAGGDIPATAAPWLVWPVLGLAWWGMAWAIIESPGVWRRAVLWVSTAAVLVAATPVAVLAGHWLPAAAPAVGWLWCGVCAWLYGHWHGAAPRAGAAARPVAGAEPSDN